MNCRTCILLSAATLLAACSTTQRSGSLEASTFGEAMKATLAAQVTDPAPQYEYLDPATSAEHAAAAVDRYRKDAVKKPERISSTSAR